MKRLWIALLTLLLIFSLFACGDKEEDKSTEESTTQTREAEQEEAATKENEGDIADDFGSLPITFGEADKPDATDKPDGDHVPPTSTTKKTEAPTEPSEPNTPTTTSKAPEVILPPLGEGGTIETPIIPLNP